MVVTEEIKDIEEEIMDISGGLQDKALEIKMLVDVNILSEEVEVSDSSPRLITQNLELSSAYVTDQNGDIVNCNEPETIGYNIYNVDPVFNELKNGAAFVTTPIKMRVGDGKKYKYLAV